MPPRTFGGDPNEVIFFRYLTWESLGHGFLLPRQRRQKPYKPLALEELVILSLNFIKVPTHLLVLLFSKGNFLP